MSSFPGPVTVTVQCVLTAVETQDPPSGALGSAGQSINWNGFNFAPQPLNANSGAWPVAGVAEFNLPVGNATVTIDLTALTNAINQAVDGTGKQVRGILLSTMLQSGNNGANIVVQPGASNPYNIDDASFRWTLGPNEVRLIWKANNAPTTASGAKTIKFTGTNAGDSINIGIVFG